MKIKPKIFKIVTGKEWGKNYNKKTLEKLSDKKKNGKENKVTEKLTKKIYISGVFYKTESPSYTFLYFFRKYL